MFASDIGRGSAGESEFAVVGDSLPLFGDGQLLNGGDDDGDGDRDGGSFFILFFGDFLSFFDLRAGISLLQSLSVLDPSLETLARDLMLSE